MTDDRESIIVNERYDLIGHFVQLSVSQTETGKVNLTDRIDQIITPVSYTHLTLPTICSV